MKTMKTLKAVFLKKICSVCCNYETHQTILDYLLYCAIISYIYKAEVNYYHYYNCIYSGKKEKLCDVCNFLKDLKQYKEMLEENIKKKTNIVQLYRLLKTFYYIMKYLKKINPKLIKHFHLFRDPFHQCLPICLNINK